MAVVLPHPATINDPDGVLVRSTAKGLVTCCQTSEGMYFTSVK
jgi:hypothetical protein